MQGVVVENNSNIAKQSDSKLQENNQIITSKPLLNDG